MIFIGILVSIIIFSLIVIIHELGHFSAARFFGVRVEEFGLGIPPRAKKLFTDKKGTLFSLNWIPLGGFVKLTGETLNTYYLYNKKGELYNNESLKKDIQAGKEIYDKEKKEVSDIIKAQILKKLEENNASYSLSNKSAWKQAIVILAGVFMNFVLAGIIFSVLFFVGVKPIAVNTKIDTNLNLRLVPTYEQAITSGYILEGKGVKTHSEKGSIAEKAGINSTESNILTEINFIPVETPQEAIDLINENEGNSIVLSIQAGCPICPQGVQCKPCNNNGSYNHINITLPKEGKIGMYVYNNISINEQFEYKYPFFHAVKYGFIETYNQSAFTLKGLIMLIGNIFNPNSEEERKEALDQMSGPIGIAIIITKGLEIGMHFILFLTAIISVALGVFNLLPIPALDGGRFLFISINGIIQKLFGKKAINANVENIIHVLFFILLIALSVVIAYNDIIKIISD